MLSNADHLDFYEAMYAKRSAQNLKYLRKEIDHEHFIFRFSKKIGVNYGSLQNLENENYWKYPNVAVIIAYRVYFKETYGLDVSADFLLGFTDKL